MRLDFDSPIWMQRALRFGAFASFLFALTVVLTFEVNSLQVSYLLKRIDAEGYLTQALPSTAVLFHLRAMDAHSAVFGVGNCSRLYAPDPERFGCLLCGLGGCTVPEVSQGLAASRYDYMILPARSDFEDWRKIVIAQQEAVEVYRDSHFAAYRLHEKSSSFAK